VIEQHPVLGEELAGFVHPLKDVVWFIRAHHERFDGRGYPDGLAGDQIPWLGRLLAVAVAYAESKLDGPVPLKPSSRAVARRSTPKRYVHSSAVCRRPPCRSASAK